MVSTGDAPRDSFVNWLAYIPRWFSYHINVTTYLQFNNEGNHKCAKQMVLGSAC